MSMIIAFPLYRVALSDGISLYVIPVMALQLLAGLDFKMFGDK